MIIGLTGSIGTGKSTVANLFKELGAYVIDWDVLAREVQRPHLKAWEGIVEYFGNEVLNTDLTLNRPKLAQMVFGDMEKVKKLNQIVHPEIYKEDARLTEEIRKLDPEAMIIKDIPLLSKEGHGKLMDKIVVVYANEQNQLKRLEKKGMNTEEAKKRIASQLPLSEKVKFADFVIYNDGSVEETKRQVEKIYAQLKEGKKND